MPITKSAEKAMRQTLKRSKRNLVTKKSYKNQFKDTVKMFLSGKVDQAKAELSKAYKMIDLAAKKNMLSRQAAARKKSRLAKMVGGK